MALAKTNWLPGWLTEWLGGQDVTRTEHQKWICLFIRKLFLQSGLIEMELL